MKGTISVVSFTRTRYKGFLYYGVGTLQDHSLCIFLQRE
jgi:hypothetical protein